MEHDFLQDDPEKKCRSTPHEGCCNGFLNYGDHQNIWSDCSVNDFQKTYKINNWQSGCLKCKLYDRVVTMNFIIKGKPINLIIIYHFAVNIFRVINFRVIEVRMRQISISA